MCPNLLIILEDSQRSYPPCSLGSALGWLLAAVNVSRLVNEPCCILSKGWPWGEAQKRHNSCMSAPRLLSVQNKAEQLKAPLEIVNSWTTAGCCKLVSGFTPNLCMASHELTSIQRKLLNWQGRFLDEGASWSICKNASCLQAKGLTCAFNGWPEAQVIFILRAHTSSHRSSVVVAFGIYWSIRN